MDPNYSEFISVYICLMWTDPDGTQYGLIGDSCSHGILQIDHYRFKLVLTISNWSCWDMLSGPYGTTIFKRLPALDFRWISNGYHWVKQVPYWSAALGRCTPNVVATWIFVSYNQAPHRSHCYPQGPIKTHFYPLWATGAIIIEQNPLIPSMSRRTHQDPRIHIMSHKFQ